MLKLFFKSIIITAIIIALIVGVSAALYFGVQAGVTYFGNDFGFYCVLGFVIFALWLCVISGLYKINL